MTVNEWAEKLERIKGEEEFYIRHCTGVSIARYCTKCADCGNGCETCKINDYAVFCGINEPLSEDIEEE
jgi:hypothetical protein